MKCTFCVNNQCVMNNSVKQHEDTSVVSYKIASMLLKPSVP